MLLATALAAVGNLPFRAIPEPDVLVFGVTGMATVADRLRNQGKHGPA